MRERLNAMAVTMLTPRDVPSGDVPGAIRWRRAAFQSVRQSLGPWLAVKVVLIGLVFTERIGVWPAFVLDTAISLAVGAYGWWLARRLASRV
jgi:cation transport ATPase